MSIQQQEEKLFEEWSRGRKSFNPDGVVDEDRYTRPGQLRLLFLLKEINFPGASYFSLTDFLRDDGGRAATWNNVTRWVMGIRALERGQYPERWLDYRDINTEKRLSSLSSICAVNLRKEAGGASSSWNDLKAAFDRDPVFLDRQITLYEPDLIICCGKDVGWLAGQLSYLRRGEPGTTRDGVGYRDLGSRQLMVVHHHPQARVSKEFLFYRLINAVREILPRCSARPEDT